MSQAQQRKFHLGSAVTVRKLQTTNRTNSRMPVPCTTPNQYQNRKLPNPNNKNGLVKRILDRDSHGGENTKTNSFSCRNPAWKSYSSTPKCQERFDSSSVLRVWFRARTPRLRPSCAIYIDSQCLKHHSSVKTFDFNVSYGLIDGLCSRLKSGEPKSN